MAFKDLRNLHLISYDNGLIDSGKFIVLYDLLWRLSLRRAAFFFCFEVKIEYRSRTALDLQLL